MKRVVVTTPIAAILLWASQAAADPVPMARTVQAPAPPADFTFKIVKPPTSATAKRILVQIDPAEQAAQLASMPAWGSAAHGQTASASLPTVTGGGYNSGAYPGTGVPAVKPGTSDWFWTLVSPKIADSQGRFSLALDSLAKGPGGQTVAVPRMQALQDIARAHSAEILQATAGTNVSPALVVAVISVESGGNPAAQSGAGAVGLMQLISATGDRFGVADRADPSQNIKGGVAYLDWLMKQFNRDPVLALAAYNAGENAVLGAGGVPPYAETRDYVPKVLAAWTVARNLCLTPPDLVSDGCVFVTGGQSL